jgi:hypothetical protein
MQLVINLCMCILSFSENVGAEKGTLKKKKLLLIRFINLPGPEHKLG